MQLFTCFTFCFRVRMRCVCNCSCVFVMMQAAPQRRQRNGGHSAAAGPPLAALARGPCGEGRGLLVEQLQVDGQGLGNSVMKVRRSASITEGTPAVRRSASITEEFAAASLIQSV